MARCGFGVSYALHTSDSAHSACRMSAKDDKETFPGTILLSRCGSSVSTAALSLAFAVNLFVGMPALAEEAAENTAATVDPEHALLNEAMGLVEDHFLDLSNKDGVVDSVNKHTYNGVLWPELKSEMDATKLRDRGATHNKIKKVLSKLGDRYTRFLQPKDFAKLTKYDVTGVGVLLVEKNSNLYVGAPPLAGSAAEAAGIKKGDRVVEIDGVAMQGKSPFEGTEMLQGVAGSQIKMKLMRPAKPEGNSGALLEVDMKRSITVEDPVKSQIVVAKDGRKVGYMKMKEFNAACKRGVADAVEKFKAEGGVSDMVLDLRGNPGGVLEGSLQIATLFMDEPKASDRTIVYVMDRNGQEEPIWLKSKTGPLDTATPLIVLVDGKSASASEVLAGSLHDNCRAAVIGKQPSFGKGLIQGAFPLSDGSGVIVTVAKYLTPKHTEIQGVGVTPDLKFDPGDGVKAIKNGKLKIEEAENAVKMCQAPPPDPASPKLGGGSAPAAAGKGRSKTDRTLEKLNGRQKAPAGSTEKEPEKEGAMSVVMR